MNKEEYLTRLQYCISQLPTVEAQNTMQYYREYFDDAGEENFASVMAELGTPEQLAAKICSSYGINYQQPVNENNTSKAVIIAIIAVLHARYGSQPELLYYHLFFRFSWLF